MAYHYSFLFGGNCSAREGQKAKTMVAFYPN
jgi:hypothetical protein